MSQYLDFMHARLGSNWVLARRSARIVARYGEDVKCLSKKEYREVEAAYRAQYGDPYDKVRAELYVAAKELLGYTMPSYAQEAAARLQCAIEAEAGAR